MVIALYGKLQEGLGDPEDIRVVLTELLALFISNTVHPADSREIMAQISRDVLHILAILDTNKKVDAELSAIADRVARQFRDNE